MPSKKRKRRRHVLGVHHATFIRTELGVNEIRERLGDGCSRTMPTTIDGVDWRSLVTEFGDEEP